MGYQIPFKSFNDTDYVLEIDGGGTALDGAADVFMTEEDNSKDLFQPVRTQTGAFKYIGQGSGDRATWLAMIPQNALDIPVKLKEGNSIKWQGYVQPQVFDNYYPADGNPVEHEYEVQCPLSALGAIDIDISHIYTTPVVSFRTLLKDYIFGKLTGTQIDGYYLQGTEDATWSRLSINVMMQNFVDVDADNNLVAKYSCLEVLEEICKILGYECRMHGTYVYFTQPVTMTGRQEVGFTLYPDLSVVTGRSYAVRGTFSITDSMFCNNNNNEQILPGYKKAIVSSDINKADNIMAVPYDDLFYQYGTSVLETYARPVQSGTMNCYCKVRKPSAAGGSVEYANEQMSLSIKATSLPVGDGRTARYSRFFVYDNEDTVAAGQPIPSSKQSFNWKKVIEVFKGYDYSGATNGDLFNITSRQAFSLFKGYLYINFDCDCISEISSGTNLRATCRLKIGGSYWNGSSWTGAESTFTLTFTKEGIYNNRTAGSPAYEGYGIYIGSNKRGIVEFAVVDVEKWTYTYAGQSFNMNGFLPMENFEIGFVRDSREDDKHEGNEYRINGGNFSDEYEMDMKFASDVGYGPQHIWKMKAGYGYILDSLNTNPMEYIKSVDNQDVIAEQEVAQLIAQYGDHTHRLLIIDMFTNLVGDVKPTMMSTGLESGLFPLAISHNWREDITTLMLLEL